MRMTIATSDLDAWGLTVVEVIDENGASRHFVPFETQRAKAYPVGSEHLLVVGAGAMTYHRGVAAVVDRKTLAKTYEIEAEPGQHIRKFAFGSDPRSVVIVPDDRWLGRSKAGDGPVHYQTRVVEVALDGAWTREVVVEDFSCHNVVVEEGGAVVLTGHHFEPKMAMAVVRIDTVSGEIKIERIADGQTWILLSALRWYSPDGRFALRHHVGTVVRDAVNPLGGLLRRDKPQHPDFRNDGQVRYGLALDLYRLVPFKLERRVITRWCTEAEIGLYKTLGERQVPEAGKPVLEALARAADYRKWNGSSQLLAYRNWGLPPEARKAAEARDRQVQEKLFDQIRDAVWDRGSSGFTVHFRDGQERRIDLSGTPGDLVASTGPARKASVSQAACNDANKRLRERSTCVVAITSLDADGVIDALGRLAERLKGNLAALTFADALVVKFQFGRRRLDAKTLSKTILGLDRDDQERVVGPLREILEVYAASALPYIGATHKHIGEGGGERDRAALSHLALILARISAIDHAVLKRWFETVDQEHDGFAADKVFPAALAHGLTDEAIRFAVWFVMTQWQTVSYNFATLGVIEAARTRFKAVDFVTVMIAEAEDFVFPRGFQDLESPIHDRLLAGSRLLDPAHAWDREVLARLPAEVREAG